MTGAVAEFGRGEAAGSGPENPIADRLGVVLCYPPHPAVDRVTTLLRTGYRLGGADPDLGRRLPSLFREAGLADVGVEARAEVYPAGHPQRTVDIDLVQAMRAKIVARGLVGEAELDMLDTAARRHLTDPETLIVPNIFFLAWARKPSS